ncbi:MAG: MarR family transcriptional regulator [Bacteroidales bacterium]
MKNLINIISELSNMMAQMEERAKDKYNTTGLTQTQMHYLEEIGRLGNPNMTELATAMKLSKPTVTVAIDKLIDRECVYKVHSDQDRRTTHLHLTEKGLQLNKTHDFAHKSIAERFSKKLDKQELEKLIELINKTIR